MIPSLLAALGATLCYGTASVMQAVGARREAGSGAGTARLLSRLVRQAPFVLGVGLDVVGALLALLALRRLPLFLVQAAVASSLAVTAVLAARVFGTRLAPREWAAVAAVGLGLVLLAASAGPESPPHTDLGIRLALLLAVAVVGVAALVLRRATTGAATVVLGALAGVAYGTANTAIRVIRSYSPVRLIENPAAWAAAAGALLGLTLFALALERGSVTNVTGAMIAAEALLPAVFGRLVLGEHPRPGWGAVAVAGFVVTVAAAGALSRFGEVTSPTPATG